MSGHSITRNLNCPPSSHSAFIRRPRLIGRPPQHDAAAASSENHEAETGLKIVPKWRSKTSPAEKE